MPRFAILHAQAPRRDATKSEYDEVDAAFLELLTGQGIERAARLDLYHLAAVVEADTVDAVFPITNHIDNSWTENDGILWHAERPRSTSMGDVAVPLDDAQCPMVCATIGWEPAPNQYSDKLSGIAMGAVRALEADGALSGAPTPGM